MSLADLEEVEVGRIQMSVGQRRRAEAGLAKHALNDVASHKVLPRVLGLRQGFTCHRAESGEVAIHDG